MVNETSFEPIVDKQKQMERFENLHPVGDAGAPVFTFLGKAAFKSKSIILIFIGNKDTKGGQHAFLMGVMSTNEYKAIKREKGYKMRVSQIEPVMKFIKKQIREEHQCLPIV